MSVYAVTGIAKYTSGESGGAAAFCRILKDGTLKVDTGTTEEVGAGGQLLSRKGTTDCELEITCMGVTYSDQQFWFPTTFSPVVASFPDFIVEVFDGTATVTWILTLGQPGAITIELPDGESAGVTTRMTAKFALVTPGTDDAAVVVYNSYSGHTRNDCTVTFPSAITSGLESFSLTNDLGVEMHNPADGKTSGSLTLPESYYISPKGGPKLSCATSDPGVGVSADLAADVWTPGDIVIAMTNGTSAENIIYTLNDWVPKTWNAKLGSGGKTAFGHEFAPGGATVYGAVTITGGTS